MQGTILAGNKFENGARDKCDKLSREKWKLWLATHYMEKQKILAVNGPVLIKHCQKESDKISEQPHTLILSIISLS